jgi:type I restriction-modification system DNA methylase subunit
MALFQRSVLEKYLKQQDGKRIAKAYVEFSTFFHNAERQANIREAKEEQFQEGFLRELFVKVLGYTLNPDPHFDLTTEFKNEVGARKADGAILENGKAIAVIELKGTDTTDLGTINTQAFNYKANQSQCVYVVTSNFEKLRFFIDNAVEHIEFDLFKLNDEQFRLLWLCLHRDSLFAGIPKKVKTESVQEEENITKKLYSDYSAFKTALWQDLVKRHPEYDQLLLFKKTQKLLDRFLFVLFCEDKGLLPPNSIREIADQWVQLRDMDAYVPLYARFQKYFGYLNTGHKGKLHDIFAYNGGLFKPDELLDAVRISDEVLHPHLMRISKYDFASEVDVNILGHIFEHSLNEIEAITAQLEGRAVDSKKTKRKKDGVFYTPKYITKYIVENTVGRLCAEKKDELAINDEEYARGRKGRQKKTIEMLDTKLDVYRDWLLSLTICDPACGSGAFLNQALDFLIAEHAYVNELEAKLLGQSIVFKDIGDHILERNIYGVDINEESVEIARLSLWLRTATKGRKLNDLSANIKCGNSLIDEPAVAGAKAFDWKKEFPAVFAKGGFDVVIGNPPYGILFGEEEEQQYKERFQLASYKMNLYVLFIERMFQVFDRTTVQFIIPSSLLINTFYSKLREHLLRNARIQEVFTITAKIWPDAQIGSSLLLRFDIDKGREKGRNRIKFITASSYYDLENGKARLAQVDQDYFLSVPNHEIAAVSAEGLTIVQKVSRLHPISNYYQLKNGLNPGNIKHLLVSDSKLHDKHRPIIWGRELFRYHTSWGGQYVLYDPEIGKTLTQDQTRSKSSMNSQSRIDYALRDQSLFETEKIILRKTADRFVAAKDTTNLYFDTLVHGIYPTTPEFSLDYLLPVLNSRFATWLYRSLHDIKDKAFAKISLENLGAFPIPAGTKETRARLGTLGAATTIVYGQYINAVDALLTLLRSKYHLPKISQNLENWPGLEFKGFLAELKKVKVQLTLAEEAEWLGYFTTEKTKAQALQAQIAKTDKEIDALVYQLYGLTAEEIAVVEGKN